MGEPPRKRARSERIAAVQSLLHVGNISNEGLAELLARLRQHDTDTDRLQGRRLVTDAFLQRVKGLAITKDMQSTDGDVFRWTFVDPNRLLTEMVSHSKALEEHFWAAVQNNPPSVTRPWHLVLGYDEFAPGNKLKVDNARKMFVLSYSFLELGQLQNDLLWFTVVAVRSCKVHTCSGGWSAFLRAYLLHHLFGPTGISTAGVPVMLRGKLVTVFASLSNLLTDGDGHRASLDWKGASSLKPCVKHVNVLRKERACVRMCSGSVHGWRYAAPRKTRLTPNQSCVHAVQV
jgi:hypothetical protein